MYTERLKRIGKTVLTVENKSYNVMSRALWCGVIFYSKYTVNISNKIEIYRKRGGALIWLLNQRYLRMKGY